MLENLHTLLQNLFRRKCPLDLFAQIQKLEISEDIGEGSGVNVYYEDIGGLKEEIEKIREMVEIPMKHPRNFSEIRYHSYLKVFYYMVLLEQVKHY